MSAGGASHPARGAWIEMATSADMGAVVTSHPARGAWIEIAALAAFQAATAESHPARGAWIEISTPSRAEKTNSRRTPQGVRGLKCLCLEGGWRNALSHPARGAWIEMARCPPQVAKSFSSHPARGAWIEMFYPSARTCFLCSRTPQGVRGLKYLTIICGIGIV